MMKIVADFQRVCSTREKEREWQVLTLMSHNRLRDAAREGEGGKEKANVHRKQTLMQKQAVFVRYVHCALCVTMPDRQTLRC